MRGRMPESNTSPFNMGQTYDSPRIRVYVADVLNFYTFNLWINLFPPHLLSFIIIRQVYYLSNMIVLLKLPHIDKNCRQWFFNLSTLFVILILVILFGFFPKIWVTLSDSWKVIVWRDDRWWPFKGHLNHVGVRLKVIQTEGGSKVGDHRGKVTGSILRK